VLAVDENINVKEWTRVHSSLEMSLHKDITCWETNYSWAIDKIENAKQCMYMS
jgi:hypothetical protein